MKSHRERQRRDELHGRIENNNSISRRVDLHRLKPRREGQRRGLRARRGKEQKAASSNPRWTDDERHVFDSDVFDGRGWDVIGER